VKRARLNLFLEPEHAKRLAELGVMKGLSKSSIVGAALAAYFSPDNADQRTIAMAKRLEQQSRQLETLERDQTILIEMFALYLRYYLSVTVPIAEAHQDAARAQGRARFAQFVQQLARHLQRGHSLVREVHTEIFPDEVPAHDRADDAQPASSETTA
jgi:hypothetical protein